jgi:hemin uptake protein HemP
MIFTSTPHTEQNMNTLQRSSSRTLHLRRDAGSTTSIAVRPAQRAGTAVLVRTTLAAPASAPASALSSQPTSGGSAVASEALLRGAKVVQIVHNGEAYQLRATRHGKLILTK